MDDLIAFLREQLATRKVMAVQAKKHIDAWAANNNPEQRWTLDVAAPIGAYIVGEWVCAGEEVARFLHFNDPETVLAEVEAKRQIVELHQPSPDADMQWCTICQTHVRERWPCGTIRLLALPYAEHPDYREEWKPRVAAFEQLFYRGRPEVAMANRDTYPFAGPIRAVHRVTKEVRGWTQRDRAEEWLGAHDNLGDWDLEIDDNPAWALDPSLLPGPDGRMRDGRPVYATPDGKPPR